MVSARSHEKKKNKHGEKKQMADKQSLVDI